MQLIYIDICRMLPKDFHNSLLPNLGRTVKQIEHHIDEMLAARGFNLTKMQFLLLHKLHERDGLCQSDLALYSNRNKSSLTRSINVLEKKNYLARIPSKEDKRINRLFITKQGLDVLDRSSSVFEEISAIMQKGISPTEVAQTIEVLKRIQANANQELLVDTINKNK